MYETDMPMWFAVNAQADHLAEVTTLEPSILKLFMVMNAALKEENVDNITDRQFHPYAVSAGLRKWRGHLPMLVGSGLVTTPQTNTYAVPSWSQTNRVRKKTHVTVIGYKPVARGTPWFPYNCHPDVLNLLDSVSAKAYKTFFLILCVCHTEQELSLPPEQFINYMVQANWRKWRQHLPELVRLGIVVTDGQGRISVPSYVTVASAFKHRRKSRIAKRINASP